MNAKDFQDAAETIRVLGEIRHYQDMDGDHNHTNENYRLCLNSTCRRRNVLADRLEAEAGLAIGGDG